MPKAYNHKELLEALKPYGVIEIGKRGKGSERMLYQPETRLNHYIKYHGKNTEYGKRYIASLKRRFDLPNDF